MTENSEATYEAALREVESAISPRTIAATRIVLGGPELAAQVSACWCAVTNKIDGRASARRTRLKGFEAEVFHVREQAREAFLKAIAEDRDPTVAQAEAEAKIWF